MTGPEHYTEAEAILAEVSGDEPTDKILAVVALAQAHLTAALVLASAYAYPASEWHKVAVPAEVAS